MRDITYPPIILMAKAAFKVLGLKFQMSGTDNIPRQGGAIIALNHISYVDFVFGGLTAVPSKRLVRFMAKRELFDHRYTGPLMRSLHHINVDRTDGIASYQTGVEYARAGEIVGIFPEATISRSMELKELKTGTVRMATEAGVPLIPAIVWGTQLMYTKDHPRDFSRGKTIALTVGEPLYPAGNNPAGDTAQLRAAMTALLDRTVASYPLSPDGQWWAPARLGGTAPTPEEALRLDAEEKRRRAKERATRRAAKRG
ncbi:MAG: 1-acyl-sn-glycerol-3-phosphate acyltransferase [Nocardioidaceae bacterium]|nr:1-acyl-sn-glycerol-3-phosphate acyltransferase [Nocardioidaceae bacterium]